MNSPLTGLSLKVFRGWCYLLLILFGLFGIICLVMGIRLHIFGFKLISGSIIDLGNTAFIAHTIHKVMKSPASVSPENIWVALIQTTLIGILIEVTIAIA